LLAGLCVVAGQERKPDPRCIQKNCTAGTTCRIVKSCPSGQACKLEAQCLENPLKDSHTGVCLVGDPILVLQNGRLTDLTCGPQSPCPIGAYCNTELMDTYSTCCMSDPEAPVKPWTCPANTFTGDDFCLDTCMNDGDCRYDAKCCEHGCNMECVHQPDICDTKQCPPGSFCHRKGMPSCTAPGQCHKEGDCIDCPPLCEIFCKHGNVLDPNGCPTCLCKKDPSVSTAQVPQPQQYPNVGSGDRNIANRPGLSWPGSRLYGTQHQWISFIPPWLWAMLLMQFQ
ncbi:hypothetical protein RRG08_065909, partial [Elysia crispata]